MTRLIWIHDSTRFQLYRLVCQLVGAVNVAQRAHVAIDVDLDDAVDVCADFVDYLGQVHIIETRDIEAIVVLGRVAEFVSTVNHLHGVEALL